MTPLKNLESHIDASHSRQPLVKGERLVRYEVNAVMQVAAEHMTLSCVSAARSYLGCRMCQPLCVSSVVPLEHAVRIHWLRLVYPQVERRLPT